MSYKLMSYKRDCFFFPSVQIIFTQVLFTCSSVDTHV